MASLMVNLKSGQKHLSIYICSALITMMYVQTWCVTFIRAPEKLTMTHDWL